MVPINRSSDVIIEDPNVDSPERRRELFGQADHVRVYSDAISDRLSEVGFNVEVVEAGSLGDRTVSKHRMTPEEKLFVCEKRDIKQE